MRHTAAHCIVMIDRAKQFRVTLEQFSLAAFNCRFSAVSSPCNSDPMDAHAHRHPQACSTRAILCSAEHGAERLVTEQLWRKTDRNNLSLCAHDRRTNWDTEYLGSTSDNRGYENFDDPRLSSHECSTACLVTRNLVAVHRLILPALSKQRCRALGAAARTSLSPDAAAVSTFLASVLRRLNSTVLLSAGLGLTMYLSADLVLAITLKVVKGRKGADVSRRCQGRILTNTDKPPISAD